MTLAGNAPALQAQAEANDQVDSTSPGAAALGPGSGEGRQVDPANHLRVLWGVAGAVWGLTGVSLLLGSAVFRLMAHVVDALALPLGWHHWFCMTVGVIFMAYSEGYRGFQRGFSPRVAARARHLLEHPTAVTVVLAPLFCMGYFHTTRRRQMTSFIVTGGIIALVVAVRGLEQPWRGILDAGVVVGLVWGLVSMWVWAFITFRAAHPPRSAELPTVGRAAHRSGLNPGAPAP